VGGVFDDRADDGLVGFRSYGCGIRLDLSFFFRWSETLHADTFFFFLVLDACTCVLSGASSFFFPLLDRAILLWPDRSGSLYFRRDVVDAVPFSPPPLFLKRGEIPFFVMSRPISFVLDRRRAFRHGNSALPFLCGDGGDVFSPLSATEPEHSFFFTRTEEAFHQGMPFFFFLRDAMHGRRSPSPPPARVLRTMTAPFTQRLRGPSSRAYFFFFWFAAVFFFIFCVLRRSPIVFFFRIMGAGVLLFTAPSFRCGNGRRCFPPPTTISLDSSSGVVFFFFFFEICVAVVFSFPRTGHATKIKGTDGDG